ncbi:hypothetical protein NC652_011304 [Populus alba x Populus x berolinensis]|nr:hypothetical protein NC652_011304 [Populus alba x Populus x berolinensis]
MMVVGGKTYSGISEEEVFGGVLSLTSSFSYFSPFLFLFFLHPLSYRLTQNYHFCSLKLSHFFYLSLSLYFLSLAWVPLFHALPLYF